MSNRVLAITNDFSNMEAIKTRGHKHNLQVQYENSISRALELFAMKDFILVAIRADGLAYMSMLRVMRELKPIPIIVFSYTNINDSEKVEALRAGADVFIAATFSPEYIIESGLALIRQYTKLGGQKRLRPGSILSHDHIILSTQSRSVFVCGEEVMLSKREFDLLHFLMKEPKRVYTYEQLYKRIGGYDNVDNPQKAIYNHIYQLRRKLKIRPEIPDYIVLVKDVGYKLV